MLTRREISEAVSGLGWRFLLGALRACVPVDSLAEAATLAPGLAALPGAEPTLRLDLRHDRLVLTLHAPRAVMVGAPEVALAHALSSAVAALGRQTVPDLDPAASRSVQMVEIGIDALDIPTIRPFWKTVLGYTDEPGKEGPQDAIVDPLGQSPAIWFQQMDAPRPQRNRIHLDICVPHDEAQRRLEAALAAGGRLVYDAEAPAFWVLADAEGNEACITTWQGRD